MRFRKFLNTQSWPNQVHWVSKENLLIAKKGDYWIKSVPGDDALTIAREIYMEGVKRELGISLATLCKSKTVTYAYVFVPTDHDEAARLLIGGLKLSIPLNARKARMVGNARFWWVLRCLYQKHTARFITDILS